jgi:hypothetical protein
MLSDQALTKFMAQAPRSQEILNIGGLDTDPHTKIMRKARFEVVTVNVIEPANIVCPYLNAYTRGQSAIWCSHCLEHQLNPGEFLQKLFFDLEEDGLLALTVPPPKTQIVGGHVTAWNDAVLIHQLIMAGFDCKRADVWRYGYNISAVMRKRSRPEIQWKMSKADLPALIKYTPEALCPK